MNYGKILGVFQRKTQLKNIENLKLSEGKIEVNYSSQSLKPLWKIADVSNSAPKATMLGAGMTFRLE